LKENFECHNRILNCTLGNKYEVKLAKLNLSLLHSQHWHLDVLYFINLLMDGWMDEGVLISS